MDQPAGSRRCAWAESSDAMRAYHDTEWGIPSRDDHYLFEMLLLEGAQAGLSWATASARVPSTPSTGNQPWMTGKSDRLRSPCKS